MWTKNSIVDLFSKFQDNGHVYINSKGYSKANCNSFLEALYNLCITHDPYHENDNESIKKIFFDLKLH